MRVYKTLGMIFTVLSFIAFVMGVVFMAFGMIYGGNEALTLMTIGESGIFMIISLMYDKIYERKLREEEKETENGEDAE